MIVPWNMAFLNVVASVVVAVSRVVRYQACSVGKGLPVSNYHGIEGRLVQ